MLAGVHLQDDDLDGLARLHHVAGFADLSLRPRHLGNMNQALDAGLEFHERSKLHETSDGAAHAVAGLELFGNRIPGMRLQLLQSDGDALLLAFRPNLEHFHFDRLADREHVGRLVDAAPGNVAHMQQRIDSAQIDEGAVVGKAAHGAAHGLAFFNLRIELVLGGALFFLGNRAAIDHDIFIGDVELDDAAANLLPDQLLHVGRVANSAARGGHERAHSHVDAESAFDHARHRAEDGRLVGESFFQSRPIHGPLDFEARKFVIAVEIAALHRDQALVAGLQGFALQGRQRQNSFRLVSDVEEHRLGVHGDHGGLQLPAAFGLAGMALLY